MSEGYTTLGQVELASDYTAGDPTMDLVDGSSLPGTGLTFSVRSMDTGVIYTCTRASNTLTVTVEFGSDDDIATGGVLKEVVTQRSLDAIRADITKTGASASAVQETEGNIYLPDDDVSLARDNGADFDRFGPICKMTPPIDADFTWLNRGSSPQADVTVKPGHVYLESGAGTGGYQWRIRHKAVSTPFTAEIGFRIISIQNNNQQFFGLTIDDGTKLISFGFGYHNAALSIWSWNSVTSSNGTIMWDQNFINNLAFTGVVFLKLVDNGTNRFYYISGDGVNWLQIYTEASGVWITPTSIGFGMATNAGSSTFLAMTVFHFKVT